MFRFVSIRSDWTKLTQFTGDAYLESMMGNGLIAASQSELVDKLKNRGFLTNVPSHVEQAFRDTDRASFSPNKPSDVYCNTPLKIGGHFMSTPQLHAQVLSLVGTRLGPGRVACEIGAGTGYLPAVFSRSGCEQVLGVENDPELVEICVKNTKSFHNVEIANFVTPNVVVDAMYAAPYFSSFDALKKFLGEVKWSEDAVVVASVADESSMKGPIMDQQMVLMERNKDLWIKTKLFRTLCEPMS